MLIPILLYHSISTQASADFLPWTVAPAQFAGQMQVLADRGYTPLKVTELAEIMLGARQPAPPNPVVITFDDGFADFQENALPVLQQHRFAATLYIITGFVGGTSQWLAREGEASRPMLSWEEITGLSHQGIEIGAHTHTHPQLDTLPESAAQAEIRTSKEQLETHLNLPVRSFAYPHGYHGPTVRRLVAEMGFTSAVAVKHAMSSLQDDRFALSRIIIKHDVSLGEFADLLSGDHLRIAPRGERIPTVVWRFARKAMKNLENQKKGNVLQSRE